MTAEKKDDVKQIILNSLPSSFVPETIVDIILGYYSEPYLLKFTLARTRELSEKEYKARQKLFRKPLSQFCQVLFQFTLSETSLPPSSTKKKEGEKKKGEEKKGLVKGNKIEFSNHAVSSYLSFQDLSVFKSLMSEVLIDDEANDEELMENFDEGSSFPMFSCTLHKRKVYWDPASNQTVVKFVVEICNESFYPDDDEVDFDNRLFGHPRLRF